MNDAFDVEEAAIDQLDAEAKRARNAAAASRRARERSQLRGAIEESTAEILEAVRRVQTLIEHGDEATRAKRRQLLRGVRAGLLLVEAGLGEDAAFLRLRSELGLS